MITEEQKAEFVEEVKENIRAGFDMCDWGDLTEDLEPTVPECDTVCCIAGAIAAASPQPIEAEEYSDSPESTAIRVWELNTGEPCELDFYGVGTGLPMSSITADDAIAHVEANDGSWPTLEGGAE